MRKTALVLTVAFFVSVMGYEQGLARPMTVDEICDVLQSNGLNSATTSNGSEIICIEAQVDEGAPGSGASGGSWDAGGGQDDDGGGSGGGPGGVFDGQVLKCMKCAADSEIKKLAAHKFKRDCRANGRKKAYQRCTGWGGGAPRNCNGNNLIGLSAAVNHCISEPTAEKFLKKNGILGPYPSGICYNAPTFGCIDECINGSGGGIAGFLISGTGLSAVYAASSSFGIDKSCRLKSGDMQLQAENEAQQCMKKNKCNAKAASANIKADSSQQQLSTSVLSSRSMSADASNNRPSASAQKSSETTQARSKAVAKVFTSQTATPKPPKVVFDEMLNRLAASYWFKEFVEGSNVKKQTREKLLVLIMEGGKRYAALSRPSLILQPETAPAPTNASKSGAHIEFGGAMDAKTLPDIPKQLKDTRNLQELEFLLIEKSIAHFNKTQKEAFIKTWPGVDLVLGSDFVLEYES